MNVSDVATKKCQIGVSDCDSEREFRERSSLHSLSASALEKCIINILSSQF